MSSKSLNHSAAISLHISVQRDHPPNSIRRFWPELTGVRRHKPDAFDLIFKGNAFEGPPRIRRQKPRPRFSGLRRMLRALVLWLLQPSPFAHRAR